MTIDLTNITSPFGLLDVETQAQLLAARKAKMRFEWYNGFGWVSHDLAPFSKTGTYRLAPGQVWPKPEPRREVRYVHLLEGGSATMQVDKYHGRWGALRIIARVRVELVEGQFDD